MTADQQTSRPGQFHQKGQDELFGGNMSTNRDRQTGLTLLRALPWSGRFSEFVLLVQHAADGPLHSRTYYWNLRNPILASCRVTRLGARAFPPHVPIGKASEWINWCAESRFVVLGLTIFAGLIAREGSQMLMQVTCAGSIMRTCPMAYFV